MTESEECIKYEVCSWIADDVHWCAVENQIYKSIFLLSSKNHDFYKYSLSYHRERMVERERE